MKKTQFTDLILFENDRVMVVNKPPMLSSLDERFAEAPSLLRMAKAHDPELRLCHRLDKETSGALILAKDDESYRFISMEFEHRRIVKKYHAVVEGIQQFEMEEVDLPIGTGRNGLMRVDFGSGKDALTYFQSVQFFRHYTLVECTPITGRTHQIRVHLAARKAVIANDTAYGAKVPHLSAIKRKFNIGKFEEEKPMIQRFALHARAVKFRWDEGQEVEVTAPYPKDMDVLLKQLEKWDS
ncbi:MAG: RNA pseudouridine synthase [Sphingobacteriaceae bacterium]|nr:RNA pseudouridine synthase [Sphingobacteriaceae bacterium]